MVNTIGTHSGRFHADEVTGVAILLALNPKATVIRSRDLEILGKLDLVLDVGGIYDHALLRYDHHQIGGADTYENGIKYSAVGLIWKHYGREYLSKIIPDMKSEEIEKVWLKIRDRIVMPIDAEDNGQSIYELNDFGVEPIKLGDAINWMNSGDLSSPDQDAKFLEAVNLMQNLLPAKIEHSLFTVQSEEKFRNYVLKSEDKRYVVLDEYLPAGDLYEEFPELLYVIYPGAEVPNWCAKAVPASKIGFELRQGFPDAWRGKSGQELAELCDVDGARFCHNAGFIAGATNRVSMIEMVSKALK